MRLSSEEARDLVLRAAGGDRAAWERLVDAYGALIWSIARGMGLSDSDAADVSQTTWLRLVENIDRLREPAAVGAWLATTARRESLNLKAKNGGYVLVEALADVDTEDSGDDVDAALLQRERGSVVREAVRTLPARGQEILVMLSADPAPSYQDVADSLGVPVGSIGPTRGRCLRRLREIVPEEIVEGCAL